MAQSHSRGRRAIGTFILPQLHPFMSFATACKEANKPAMLLWEGEKTTGLHTVLNQNLFKTAQSIALFVGPEGGFSAQEVEQATRSGIVSVSLGKEFCGGDCGTGCRLRIMYARGELESDACHLFPADNL